MHSLSLSSDWSATLISWFTQIVALHYRDVHISVPIHSGSSWIQWDTVRMVNESKITQYAETVLEWIARVGFSCGALVKQLHASSFLEICLKSERHVTSDFNYFISVTWIMVSNIVWGLIFPQAPIKISIRVEHVLYVLTHWLLTENCLALCLQACTLSFHETRIILACFRFRFCVMLNIKYGFWAFSCPTHLYGNGLCRQKNPEVAKNREMCICSV